MPSPPPSQSLPLRLLKLAAAAVAGGAALLSFLRLRRRILLSSIRLDLLNSLLLLLPDGRPNGAARPPSFLVTGFRSHGKSALVNTICRVLSAERGPLVMRSETAPPGPTPATVARRVIRADVAGVEEAEGEAGEEETAEVWLVDGVGFPAAEEAGTTRADVEAEVAGPSGGGGDVEVDCVVVVVRCGAPAKERRMAVRRLADVASAVRGRGGPPATRFFKIFVYLISLYESCTLNSSVKCTAYKSLKQKSVADIFDFTCQLSF